VGADVKELLDKIEEASYPGNLGFVEMMKFYQVADKEDIKTMEKYLKSNDPSKAWELLKKVTKVNLQGIKFKK
jgi:hypothetical protein